MKKGCLSASILCAAFCLFAITKVQAYGDWQPVAKPGETINPNKHLLVSNEEEQPFIINDYTGMPGCYIACLGHSEGLYKIGSKFHMHGLIRINGQYPVDSPTDDKLDRLCYPTTVEDVNEIKSHSAIHYYVNLCNQHFPNCDNGCWGSNDTGGYFTRTPQYTE